MGMLTHRLGDKVFNSITLIFAAGIGVLVITMLIEMVYYSRLPIGKFGFSFLWRQVWDPVAENYGAIAFIYGTIASSVISLLISVPVSVGLAIFLVEQAPQKLANPIAFVVQLLAAIPSVVYGLWGIFVLAPLLRNYVYPAIGKVLGFIPIFSGPQNGLGLLTAALILSIMIVPIITAISTDILRAVPNTQREAALALGATKWEATQIVLQNARSGITGAVILGLGRAIGETMAVTMLIGNRPEIFVSLFAPSYTIASSIANEFTEATSEMHRQSLIELGLVLFIITFIINTLARVLVWSVTRGKGKGANV
jgi:phosphate transport system permease protein